MDCTAQWINDVSAMTANAQLVAKSHPYDTANPPSSRHPPPSTRDLTPDGSEEGHLEIETGPDDLDDPWPYTFRMGDNVWIRTEGGNWYPGKVSSQSVKRGQTRQNEGLFYPVIFRIGTRIRKHFAPLNGEIKPDTLRTRTLLRRAGWL